VNTDILDDFTGVDPRRRTEMQNVPQWLYQDMGAHLTDGLRTRLSRLFAPDFAEGGRLILLFVFFDIGVSLKSLWMFYKMNTL
jgi:hypothetical protein